MRQICCFRLVSGSAPPTDLGYAEIASKAQSRASQDAMSARGPEELPWIGLSLLSGMEALMADLLVRGVEDGIVRALKKRAGAHGRSAEAEHRAILAAALLSPPRRNLAELLAAMPDVGLDADFERQDDITGAADVLG